MKNLLTVFILACFAMNIHAQEEEVGPLMGNPQLQKNAQKNLLKMNDGTFDSTFIYTQDTIGLPVFDEFSTNKFQNYNADYTDVGVTFDKVYRLMTTTGLVLPNGENYTTQVTFYRTVDLGNGTVVDVPFVDTVIRIGDLASYPVTFIPTSVYPPFYIYDTIDFPNPVDTIWISPDVVQDSATQFFANVNDLTSIWIDDQAYHNYTFAREPWSLGVATFDGLDENGYPYEFGTAITNYGDRLTSKPIDMGAVNAGDSVYFSFLYQPQGFGDAPESGDSLVLEFYAINLDQWNRVWSVNGSPSAGFQMVHLNISDPDYLQKGFQFRFRNYGGLSGSLDHFHVDYVNLRAFSGVQDTVIRDFAIVYPIKNLLDTYSSVPWDHYVNNSAGKMSSNVEVLVRNSDNVPENEQDGTTEIQYSGTTESTYILLESLLNNGDLNYSPRTTYTSLHDFSTGVGFDISKPGPREEFDIVSGVTHLNTSFTQNDSSYTKQIFQNYYSYDDGTAEGAYGPLGIQARLAIKYTPYEADSLIGARIHFVPSVYDVSNKLFILTVWDDNGGEPGNVIYEDGVFFPRQPFYEYDRDIFTNYYFIDTQKVSVSGTFYIGWKQFDADRLNVGFDKNTINNDKTYFSTNNGISWTQSSIPGSVMIHPIFSTSYDAVLGIEEKKSVEVNVRLFPNPTSANLTIEMENDDFEFAEIHNLQGRLVKNSSEQTMNVSDLPKGMYLVRINGKYGPYKIIKQ